MSAAIEPGCNGQAQYDRDDRGYVMIEKLNLEDWAWQVAAEVYRLNLFCQLTGRTMPHRSSVTEEELAAAIRDSLTQFTQATYRQMVDLATDAALETFDRIVSSVVKESRVRPAH
ncbi:hypothetical protein QA641_00130 [Bradyrhizobium sp. CB1650]|uniref:hypothetical protein n=1 Tax=Bradyrhizobium sp. CB1650 TaxID=3039153 RepID=UPI002435AE27|nr:hypothetical protein [Bradyrhizobium sp. CB1650]WGD52402.1 hypothetical protein QA641_00130 [Bradyrhizobium sp. CB1650]